MTPQRPVRPRPAAGVVVLRRGASGFEVLLGRRSRWARFMPDVYVVPGGTLTAEDAQPSGFVEPLARPRGMVDQETQRRLAVFARAALRETQEETGLLLVRAGSPPLRPSRSEVWRRYAAAGRTPAFDRLRLLARAITPTDSPIRYHTRFFLCCGAEVTGTIGGDGELEDVGWKSIAETGALDMPGVTRWLLGEALAAAGLEQAPKVQLRTWRSGGPDSVGLVRVVE